MAKPKILGQCFVIEDGVQCENDAKQHGMCSKHYMRVRAHGSPYIKLPTGRAPTPPGQSLESIKEARRRGETLEQIGDRYGVTKQYIHTLLKKHGGDPKKEKTAAQ